jgi:hypothetical protein
MTFPNPCRAEFERLSQEDPAQLLAWVRSGELQPSDLTFAAEYLGRNVDATSVLIDITKHESPIVREGALHGLYQIMSTIDCKILYVSEADESPGVRYVAKDIAEYFGHTT